MTEKPQNPILKAHLEGKELFDKKFWALGDCPGVKEQRAWIPEDWLLYGNLCDHDDYTFCERRKKYLDSFLTTYAENILNAAKEAGPGEKDDTEEYEEPTEITMKLCGNQHPLLNHDYGWMKYCPECGSKLEEVTQPGTNYKWKSNTWNSCLSSFISAIDEGIKEIKSN